MYLVFESEVLYRREYLTERIENLSHGRYLPVEVPAADMYGKGIHLGLLWRIHFHTNSILRGLEFDSVESNLRFSVVFINCSRPGTENAS
jgi:hypothetical protein